MGHAVEETAIERGHTIGIAIDNAEQWNPEAVAQCDVAIDFSFPTTAVDNIRRCWDCHVPVVMGTTGWYDQLETLKKECIERGETFFVASNFSIGMNIMFDLNRRLAQLMDGRSNYTSSITETHHIHKLDAPSGTAITLANEIERQNGTTVPIKSIRKGEIAGIHEVVYDSDVDTITLVHSAKNRKGLALGAVLAAEFSLGRKGYLTMEDLLAKN